MKPTLRIERINANLDKHFKSNNGAWWVSNGIYVPGVIELHRGIGGNRIDPRDVAAFIFRTEPSVTSIHTSCTLYTRTTLSWAGYKF